MKVINDNAQLDLWRAELWVGYLHKCYRNNLD